MTYLTELIEKLKVSKSIGIPKWLSNRNDIKEWLVHSTRQYDVKNIMERIYIVINGDPPLCLCNNKRVFDTYEKGYRVGCNKGNKCFSVSKFRVDNQKITLLEKYNVTNAALIPDVKEKIKNTNIEKYGVEYPLQNSDINNRTKESQKNRTHEDKVETVNKIKLSNIEKYGVEHHMKLISQQQKVYKTNIEKYGVEYPLQNSDIKSKMKITRSNNHNQSDINEKSKQTNIDRYGVEHHSQLHLSKETLEILSDKDLFIEYIENKERQEILDTLDIANHTLYLYAKKYEASDLIKKPLRSNFEKEVCQYLDTLDITYIIGDRTVLCSKELDIYIPSYNLAIECNGLYWHSENGGKRDKNYHYDKFINCSEKNIRLISIFEDEWNTKQDHVKKILDNVFKKNNTIMARKCVIKECDSRVSLEFLDNNHIQGNISSSIKIGLYHSNKLVALMTFGKSRYDKKYEYELLRYCSTVNVVGGISKLFKYFCSKYNPKSIISYSDNRYFSGNMYSILGFKKDKTTVGYFYTDYKKRHDRIKFQKHKLVKSGNNINLTEWQIMQNNGYDRIWDCGQVKWIYDIEKINNT